MAVAVAVASGIADVGIGVKAAAGGSGAEYRPSPISLLPRFDFNKARGKRSLARQFEAGSSGRWLA